MGKRSTILESKEAIKQLRAQRDETIRQVRLNRDLVVRGACYSADVAIREYRAWCKQEVSKILGK